MHSIKTNFFLPYTILIFNGLVSASILIDSKFVERWYVLAAGLSILGYSYLVFIKKNNILFLSRTLILGLIGYYPIFIKCINPNGFYSYLSPSTQTLSIALTMYMLTNLAIISNEFGLLMGRAGMVKKAINHIQHDQQGINFIKFMFWFNAFLVIIVASLTFKAEAPSLFSVSYGSGDHGDDFLKLGNLNIIGLVGLFVMMLTNETVRIQFGKKMLIICILYFVVWVMFLHGMRMDVLNAVLGLYVVYQMKHDKEPRISAKIFFVSIIFCLLFQFWGAVRTTGTLLEIDLSTAYSKMINLSNDEGTYHFGTVSPISTTFSHTVYLVDHEILPLMLGKSYWEYILRTPPEIIYPDRPKDYAYMFMDYGLAACGGIYELAEAYMNFGALGCLLIPGIISFFLARSYRNTLYKQRLWDYYLMFTFTSAWLRGSWYQTFAFYKAGLTCIILFYISKMVYAYFFKPFIANKINYDLGSQKT